MLEPYDCYVFSGSIVCQCSMHGHSPKVFCNKLSEFELTEMSISPEIVHLCVHLPLISILIAYDQLRSFLVVQLVEQP